jgi:hypothetical protein
MINRIALPLLCFSAGMVLFGAANFRPLIAASFPPLPTGNTGIASRYPGDSGIGSDPEVVFADDFESYSSVSGLTSRWNEMFHTENIRLATESSNVFRGGKSLEFTVPQSNNEISNNAIKYVNPTRDVLFVRYHAKLDTSFNAAGSSHNGNSISAKYCCPGVPANGTNKFLVSLETWRDGSNQPNPGQLNVYMYHPDQRDIWGDHFYPTGIVSPFTNTPFNYGPEFVSRPDFTPVLGRWYSYELMVKTNTPGQRDGRVAVWVDGNLVADFHNLRLRETTSLKIDQFTIDLHVNNPSIGMARKWSDNVVAATSYIGPVSTSTGQVPSPPRNLRIVP